MDAQEGLPTDGPQTEGIIPSTWAPMGRLLNIEEPTISLEATRVHYSEICFNFSGTTGMKGKK